MKLFSLFLLFAFYSLPIINIAQCTNDGTKVESIWSDYYPTKDKPQAPFTIKNETGNFVISDDANVGKMVVISLNSEEKTGDSHHYVTNVIFAQSKINSLNTAIPFNDNWNKQGLDSHDVAIGRFCIFNSMSYNVQWTNWGGHILGKSEGELVITKADDNEICGYFNFIAYANGSTSDDTKKTVISKTYFTAKKEQK